MGVLTDSFAKCSWAKSFDIQGLNKELDKIESSLGRWKELHPRPENVLDAFVELKVFPEIVIVGTEPYKDDGQATGVPFSVPDSYNENPPKTLKTLNRCFGFEKGLRSEWVKWMNERHVLLLNCALTYSPKHGTEVRRLWRGFIELIVVEILKKDPNTHFWLLGAKANSLRNCILDSRFKVSEKQVISSCHPSYVHHVGGDACPCYQCFASNWLTIAKAVHKTK